MCLWDCHHDYLVVVLYSLTSFSTVWPQLPKKWKIFILFCILYVYVNYSVVSNWEICTSFEILNKTQFFMSWPFCKIYWKLWSGPLFSVWDSFVGFNEVKGNMQFIRTWAGESRVVCIYLHKLDGVPQFSITFVHNFERHIFMMQVLSLGRI